MYWSSCRQVRNAERYNWSATQGVNEELILENLPEHLQRNIRRHLFEFVKKVRSVLYLCYFVDVCTYSLICKLVLLTFDVKSQTLTWWEIILHPSEMMLMWIYFNYIDAPCMVQ